MSNQYRYEELKNKALAADATQEDLATLADWFDTYYPTGWNGERYSVDGDNLYPIYNEQDEIVGYEFR